MSKKLCINAAICDIRGITEEKAKAYDRIDINAACIFTSPEAKRVLLNTTVNMNSAQTVDLDEKVQLVSKNGSFTLKKDSFGTAETFLLINGSLEIEPGAVEAAKSYFRILVNGEVVCPQSASEAMSSISVNGSTSFYPDHKNTFNGKVDSVFLARLAEGEEYYTRGKVDLLSRTDYAPLEAVTIEASAAYIYESFIPSAAKIFTRNTPIVAVPDGTVVVKDCPQLTGAAAALYGPRMFVESDLEITDREALDHLKYLKVTGTAYVKEDLLPLPDYVEAGAVIPYRSRIIRDMPNIDVDRELLEAEPQGVLIADCAAVNLAADIPSDLIRSKLLICDCAVVRCSAEQRGAVNAVAHDVAAVILPATEDAGDPNFDAVEEINAAQYCI